jgi:hypothetical protein
MRLRFRKEIPRNSKRSLMSYDDDWFIFNTLFFKNTIKLFNEKLAPRVAETIWNCIILSSINAA